MPTAIRTDLLQLTPEALRAIVPYLAVTAGVAGTLVLSVVHRFPVRTLVMLFTLGATALGALASARLLTAEPAVLFGGGMISDPLGAFFNLVFLSSAALTALVSYRYLEREALDYPEYYVLILLSAMGMMWLASAQDVVVLFLALELMSFAVYALVGFRRNDRRSNEAAIKYYLLGSAASAILLYGAALLYGATGSLQLTAIWEGARNTPSPLFWLGAWLFVAGLLFKVAAVPFHMWMPDVYEGAPTPVTGFMTTGVKIAAFAAFLRVFLQRPPALEGGKVETLLILCAILTMVVGNLLAVSQSEVKRMLAYSSIAHTGYLLLGFVAGPRETAPSILLYLLTYGVMAMGAFAVLSAVAGPGDRGLRLGDLSGLASRKPGLSFALAVFLLSLAGLPPTAGFVAKYFLFYGAVQAGHVWLVVVAVLCSLVSVFYYLRVLVHLYMREAAEGVEWPRLSTGVVAVVTAMVTLTLQIGVLPERWLSLMRVLPMP